MASTSTTTCEFNSPITWDALFYGSGKETASPVAYVLTNPGAWAFEIQSCLSQTEDDIRRLSRIHRQQPETILQALPGIQREYESLARAVQTIADALHDGGSISDDEVDTIYLDVIQAGGKLATQLWTAIMTAQPDETGKISAFTTLQDRQSAASDAYQVFASEQKSRQDIRTRRENVMAATVASEVLQGLRNCPAVDMHSVIQSIRQDREA